MRIGKFDVIGIIMALITISLCGVLLLTISLATVACVNNAKTVTPIESASLSGQTDGSFGLFGGSIDEEQYYFFYVNEGEGKMLEKVKADETIVIETDKRRPHIVRIWCQDDRLYVPKGTVIKDYHVAQPGLGGDVGE